MKSIITLFFTLAFALTTLNANSQETYNQEYQIAKINTALKDAFYSTKNLFRAEIKVKDGNLLVETIRNRDGFTRRYSIPINKIDLESMKVGKDKTQYAGGKKPKTYQVYIKSINKERVVSHSAFKKSKYSTIKFVVNSKEKGNDIIDMLKTLIKNYKA